MHPVLQAAPPHRPPPPRLLLPGAPPPGPLPPLVSRLLDGSSRCQLHGLHGPPAGLHTIVFAPHSALPAVCPPLASCNPAAAQAILLAPAPAAASAAAAAAASASTPGPSAAVQAWCTVRAEQAIATLSPRGSAVTPPSPHLGTDEQHRCCVPVTALFPHSRLICPLQALSDAICQAPKSAGDALAMAFRWAARDAYERRRALPAHCLQASCRRRRTHGRFLLLTILSFPLPPPPPPLPRLQRRPGLRRILLPVLLPGLRLCPGHRAGTERRHPAVWLRAASCCAGAGRRGGGHYRSMSGHAATLACIPACLLPRLDTAPTFSLPSVPRPTI